MRSAQLTIRFGEHCVGGAILNKGRCWGWLAVPALSGDQRGGHRRPANWQNASETGDRPVPTQCWLNCGEFRDFTALVGGRIERLTGYGVSTQLIDTTHHGDRTMKNAILLALLVLPTTAFAVENPSRYQAYQERLAARKAYALDARRSLNATKGPHVYRTAIAVPAPITPFIAIEKGWVHQPAIPVRPLIGVGLVSAHADTGYVHSVGHAYGTYRSAYRR